MAGIDILCCGELTMDEISVAEDIADGPASVKLRSTDRFYGGRGGNVAASASIFGAKVGIVAALGSDPEGSAYKAYLASKKVDVSNLFNNKNAHTNKCFIFNAGEKTRIFFYGGAIREEREAYVRHARNAVRNTAHKAVFCTSPDQEINASALSGSKSHLRVYAPSSNVQAHPKRSVVECLSNTDMLFLNQNEAEFLGGLLKLRPDGMLQEYGIKTIITTQGGSGSKIMTKEETIRIPPFRPSRVLDTSGAGDAFAGSFVANYLKTGDPERSGRIASAVASLIVEEVGCQTNLPSREKLAERMESESR